MGQDIHMIAERLSAPGVFPWTVVEGDPVKLRPQGRNYYFFELLRYLGTPGLPTDISEQARCIVKEDYEEEDDDEAWERRFGAGWLGGHSFHHATLELLLRFDWEVRMDVLRWKDGSALALPADSALVPQGDPATVTWRAASGTFLEYLGALQSCGRPHEVRVLYGFDS